MSAAANLERLASNQIFGGVQQRFAHDSAVLGCRMNFSVFLPSAAKAGSVPVIYWLSGLTCTDENFVQKAGAQQYAERYGVMIVAPDTSPRGDHVPDDEEGAWDFGKGAGFYVNATQAPWSANYQMYDYIVRELPALIGQEFPADTHRCSIMGHSMGGHGALTIALKNSTQFRSASAFAPIASPMACPWGHKALGQYLGDEKDAWRAYDTVELIKEFDGHMPLLVDQGDADTFLTEQLKPELLQQACEAQKIPLNLHMREGYDHSYFFIATFIGDHIEFHHQHLASA